MPTRKMNPADKRDASGRANVESGGQEDARKVARTALRRAIDEGDASGVAAGNSFDRVRQALKFPTKKR